jgi:hypothetical protein
MVKDRILAKRLNVWNCFSLTVIARIADEIQELLAQNAESLERQRYSPPNG